ncbi:MAG: lipid-A-disaccharide synthase [Vulcanimicrobiaceae bacterium]
MRIFVATGEASGDMLAAALATAMRERTPDVTFAGVGSERMAAAGFALTTRTTGWAAMGPLEALRRIPPLFANVWRHALWLRARPWDLVVLVDFGAYNLRFAKTLRLLGYRRPILYFMPPGAWLDKPSQARAVARYATALTGFAHQRDFYASLGLPIAYFGHPLVSLVAAREARAAAPAAGGTIAILPGSRRGELERHLPPLLEALRVVRTSRPYARFVIGAADGDSERTIARALAAASLPAFGGHGSGVDVVRGARAALDGADAAWIASGTAVLEAALREVPAVAFYVIARAQVALAKRVWQKPYITLPNILADAEVVPELVQDAVTPQNLAAAIEPLLADPSRQLAGLRAVRATLGAGDALERCAAFAVALARTA